RRSPCPIRRSHQGSRRGPPRLCGSLPPVAQEQMRSLSANADQPALLGLPTEVHPMDQPERSIALLAGEHRGDGQKQLIDPIVCNHLAKEPGTSLGKDPVMAVGFEEIEDLLEVDSICIGDSPDLGDIGNRPRRRAAALTVVSTRAPSWSARNEGSSSPRAE